jgi:O-antigen biosynthesis protein
MEIQNDLLHTEAAGSPLPATSLIICSRNRPQLLTETVISVLEGTEVPAELIIVDQSDQENYALAELQSERECEIRYIWVHTVGVGRARNTGITEAKYNILAITDDDVKVTPAWFGALIRAQIEAGPGGVVSGRVLSTEAELPGGFAPSTTSEEVPAVYEGRVGKDLLFTGNMAMFKSAVLKVGYFDERLGPGAAFPAAEDNDFGYRLLESGYRMIYAPEALLYHRAWRSEKAYLRLRWNYGVGRGGFYAKYLSLRDRYIFKRMLDDIRIHLVVFVRGMPGGAEARQKAFGDAALALGIIYGAIKWLMTQRRTN